MTATAERLAYRDTGFFSEMILDYLEGHPGLSSCYRWPVDAEGIRGAMEARRNFTTDRGLLVQVLQEQYAGRASALQQEQIEQLASPHTFTVCTAHQPNLFTGHLYFVYKILHCIRLSRELNELFPGERFVPVYYIGSEDADLEELGQVQLDGKTYRWQTRQSGAVGRMKVDDELVALIRELSGQLNVLPYGAEWTNLLLEAYQPGISIAEATATLVNRLFGAYGLLVLQPDNRALKAAYVPVMERELLEQFSAPAVQATAGYLARHYHVQAAGRELNLFYLGEGLRERIEKLSLPGEEPAWTVVNTAIRWSRETLLTELKTHPEHFSPNVILRPLYQESILPNVAFIGGGGEIAYWLELKNVFDAASVPFPVLVLRNSFLLADERHTHRKEKLALSWKALFEPEHALLSRLVKAQSQLTLSLAAELEQLQGVYERMSALAGAVEPTLARHTQALYQQALKRAQMLEKKMLRAEKKKFPQEQQQLQALKTALFPNGNLQERVKNIMGWYARYGSGIIDALLENSTALDQQFTVLELPGVPSNGYSS